MHWVSGYVEFSSFRVPRIHGYLYDPLTTPNTEYDHVRPWKPVAGLLFMLWYIFLWPNILIMNDIYIIYRHFNIELVELHMDTKQSSRNHKWIEWIFKTEACPKQIPRSQSLMRSGESWLESWRKISTAHGHTKAPWPQSTVIAFRFTNPIPSMETFLKKWMDGCENHESEKWCVLCRREMI